jgi:hypothetical protein
MLELSSLERQIFILVKQGKYDVAIGMAKQHLLKAPGLVMQFADALLAAGEAKKALRYMTEEYNANTSYSCGEWLAKYHCEQGDAKTALAYEEAGFLKRPWLENYQRIQQLAEPIGSTPKTPQDCQELETIYPTHSRSISHAKSAAKRTRSALTPDHSSGMVFSTLLLLVRERGDRPVEQKYPEALTNSQSWPDPKLAGKFCSSLRKINALR